MREFIPSDYIDKEGNVYETVGENIREGKNGAVTSDFPTPEDIGSGLVGSDGTNYVVILKNLGDISTLADSSYVIRYRGGVLLYESPIMVLDDTTNTSTPPMSKAVVDYIIKKSIIPKGFKIYTMSFTYDGSTITIANPNNIPALNVKVIGDHFVIKSSLGISFIEITKFTPVTAGVVILDTQIYFDEMKLSARINTNNPGTYEILLIAG